MQRIIDVNTSYEKLPLVNLKAPKVESRRSIAGKTPSAESIKQDHEDAEKVFSAAVSQLHERGVYQKRK